MSDVKAHHVQTAKRMTVKRDQYIAAIQNRLDLKNNHVGGRAVGGKRPLKKQREAFNKVQSIDYLTPDLAELPDHASVERKAGHHHMKADLRHNALNWALFSFLGIVVAVVVYFLLKGVKIIEVWRITLLQEQLFAGDLIGAWLAWAGTCSCLCLMACVLVLFCPAAASSGIPGLLAYLNGSDTPNSKNVLGHEVGFLSLNTLVAKTFGALLSVPSGLCIGPEGPIIHIGAMLGKQTIRFLDWGFTKLDNAHPRLRSYEVRDLLATGAGCGIAVAFHAPLSGVLFVVEEATSFFNVNHIEKTFLACVTAFWMLWVLESAFYDKDSLVKFDAPTGYNCSLYAVTDLIMFLVIGVGGGLLGALFNFIVENTNKFRRDHINAFPLRRLLEVVFIALLTATSAVFLPMAVPCQRTNAQLFLSDSTGCMDQKYLEQIVAGSVTQDFLYRTLDGDAFKRLMANNASLAEHDPRMKIIPFLDPNSQSPTFLLQEGVDSRSNIAMPQLSRYTCPEHHYNPLASLLLKPGVTAVQNMFLRGAPHLYSNWALLLFLLYYFFFAAITSGIAVPAGLVVPMMLMGGAFGRLVGQLNLEFKRWECGAAAKLDQSQGIAQWAYQSMEVMHTCNWPDPGSYALVGAGAIMGGTGRITLFLATMLLEIVHDIKMMPPITFAIIVSMWVGNRINHGLYHALIPIFNIPFLNDGPDFVMKAAHTGEVMSTKLVKMREKMPAQLVEDILNDQEHNHMAFPVVNKLNVLKGIVSRERLELEKEYWMEEGEVDMPAYMDRSPLTVYPHTPLERTFNLFRSMGMRHLCVVGQNGTLVGMITRKDLQRWKLHEPNDDSYLFLGHHDGSVPSAMDAQAKKRMQATKAMVGEEKVVLGDEQSPKANAAVAASKVVPL